MPGQVKAKEKRKGGQLAENGEWLVITESTGEPGVDYTHNCGGMIMGTKVAHPIWDGPFPNYLELRNASFGPLFLIWATALRKKVRQNTLCMAHFFHFASPANYKTNISKAFRNSR